MWINLSGKDGVFLVMEQYNNLSDNDMQSLCKGCKNLCWYHAGASYRPRGVEVCGKSSGQLDDGIPSCHKNCTTYSRIKLLFDSSGLPSVYWDYIKMIRSNDDISVWNILNHIMENVLSFVNQGQNVLLTSQISGNGKTTIASCIIKALIRAAVIDGKFNTNNVRYIYIPEFISSYEYFEHLDKVDDSRKEFFSSTQSLKTSRFVVWDGFGYDSKTRAEEVIVRSILHTRINYGKSNMIISSMDMNSLRDILRPSDFERLSNSSLLLDLKSRSYRQLISDKFVNFD